MTTLLCGIGAAANDSVGSAVKRLSTVQRFAFGPVGYAGLTSKGEIDFKILLPQPPQAAINDFERLSATGNPQGRLYALSGMKRLNPKRFKQLVESSEKSREQVQVMRGCIISHEALGDVARQIDKGKFRF